jgi:long-chain acyl-CoA synthetase
VNLFDFLAANEFGTPGRPALEDDRGRSLSHGALASRVRGVAETLAAVDGPVAVLASNALDAARVRVALTDDPDRMARLAPRARRDSSAATARLLPALAAFRFDAPSGGPTDARVTFTSGTTGRPRGVRLGAGDLLRVAQSLAEATGADRDERHLALLPLGVLLEEVGGLLRTLLAGGTVVLPRDPGTNGASRGDGERLAATAHACRATSAVCVPQILAAWVAALERAGRPMGGLRFVGVGGASVAPPLLRRAHAVGIPAYEGYGLTEACSVVTLNVPGACRPGSVGRPLPHAEVRVAEDGEVLVRGATLAGYVGGTGGPDADGWWRTGDLGRIDDEGFVHLLGRRGNVFVTSYGRNISPEWIEGRLTGCPSVAQAVVLGEARPRPVAVLVTGAPREVVDAEVARAVESLPEYARPAGWVRAREPFTAERGLATTNGRPLRDAVARAYADALSELETPSPVQETHHGLSL